MLAHRPSPPGRWVACGAVALCLALAGGPCSTGNPGTVFDPDDPGGGGPGGDPPPADGDPAAPAAGALLLDGRPEVAAHAPVADDTGVDVLTPVVLWFEESVRQDTVTSASLVLQPEADPAAVSYAKTWLVGGRCLALEPSASLLPDTRYEVAATAEITDLEGRPLVVPADGVLFAFRTAPSAVGVAPRVLGSFPPDGAARAPNDHAAVVAFSKPINPTGISGAVSIRNLDEAADAAYDLSGVDAHRHAGDRVIEFPHVDDAADLGDRLRLSVATSITDVEFVPNNLEAPYQAEWTTLNFGRPVSVAPFDADPMDPFDAAVNLGNVDAFPVDVAVPPTVRADDGVTLLAHETGESPFVSQTLPAGAGTQRFDLDLTDADTGATLFDANSELVLAAYVERGARRSTVQVPRDGDGLLDPVAHDTVRPLLFRYGPPSGRFGSQFVTDLPELRPYGSASEAIARVVTEFPPGGAASTRDAPDPGDGSFFIGSAAATGTVEEGPLSFQVLLTDAAGNEAAAASPGTVVFRGFVDDADLASSGGALRVVLFDRRGLFLLAGATVHVEDFGGGNEASGTTGSDGSVTFPGRSGPQTVTAQLAGWDAVSLVGVDAATVSLPMPPAGVSPGTVTPVVDGVTTGVLTAASSLLAGDDSEADPAGATGIDLEALFGPGMDVRLQRPGWYAAFHEVRPFDSPASYFRFFAADPRVLVPPTTGSELQPPEFSLVESSNAQTGGTDNIHPLAVAPGAGFASPVADSMALAVVAIPGLGGSAAVGAGSVDLAAGGTNGDVEREPILHGLAIAEGAPAAAVRLQVYAEDADGDRVVARVTEDAVAAPPVANLQMPDVPVVGPWSGGGHPYSIAFTDTLSGADGYYRIVVRDTGSPRNEWHLWVPASAAGGGSLTLPGLRDAPGAAAGAPPLEDRAGSRWFARADAYRMPAGTAETGLFFAELVRDFVSWARAVEGPALEF